MKGVALMGNSRVEVREFPDPKPEAGQVVIKMGSAGLCGSDLPPYRSTPEELGML